MVFTWPDNTESRVLATQGEQNVYVTVERLRLESVIIDKNDNSKMTFVLRKMQHQS